MGAALLVAGGGVVGVLARWGISRLPYDWATTPWATVGINVLGSFALGVLVTSAVTSRDVRDAVGVGVLGGFTTFSAFSVHVVQELDAGHPGRAAALVLASTGGGVLAAAAGFALGRG